MNKLWLVLALALLTVPLVPERAVSQASKTLQPTEQQKIVHDPAEFKAYIDASHLTDPAERGAAMEAFVARYPSSAVYPEALQQAMAAYQAAGNGAKVVELAERLLKFEPKNVQALAILAFAKMNADTPKSAAEAKGYAERGLKLLPGWKRQPGVSKAQFEVMRKETGAIFYSAIGLAALYAKDYPAARAALLKTVTINLGGFVDTYRLAVAELEATPLDPNGFWYIAKSVAMARSQNPGAAEKIEPYAAAKYKKYHGSMDGWDALLASAAKEKTPPKGFTVTPAAGN
jgi:hypothetical protein